MTTGARPPNAVTRTSPAVAYTAIGKRAAAVLAAADGSRLPSKASHCSRESEFPPLRRAPTAGAWRGIVRGEAAASARSRAPGGQARGRRSRGHDLSDEPADPGTVGMVGGTALGRAVLWRCPPRSGRQRWIEFRFIITMMIGGSPCAREALLAPLALRRVARRGGQSQSSACSSCSRLRASRDSAKRTSRRSVPRTTRPPPAARPSSTWIAHCWRYEGGWRREPRRGLLRTTFRAVAVRFGFDVPSEDCRSQGRR